MKTFEVGVYVFNYLETTVEANTKAEAIQIACEQAFDGDFKCQTDFCKEVKADE